MRWVWLALVGLACRSSIDVQRVEVPFACAVDSECNAPWRCSQAGACFDPRVEPATTMFCATGSQCPDSWRCSELVEDVARCVKQGVGTTVRCSTDKGCEGGWRCGQDGRCFDAKVQSNAVCAFDTQCADGMKCGQLVEGQRNCVSTTVGAPNACVDDQGCAGGWRCDVVARQCVDLDDTVQTRPLALSARTTSPLQSWPVPQRFNMSQVEFDNGRLVVSAAFVGANRIRWVALRNESAPLRSGGTGYVELTEWTYPGASGVDSVVSTPNRLYLLANSVVTVCDRSPTCTSVDAGGAVTGLRASAALSNQRVDDAVAWGSWFAMTFPDAGTFDAGGLALAALVDSELFGFTGDEVRNLRSGARLGSLGFAPAEVRAGMSDAGQASLLLLGPADGGPVLGFGRAPNWKREPQACPDGGSPTELWFGQRAQDQLPSAMVRCPVEGFDGGVLFAGRVDMNQPVRWSNLYEDQTPWQFGDVEPMKDGVVGRAQAAKGGRAWFANLSQARGGSVLGVPLQPLVLDRQPDTIVVLGNRGLAQAGDFRFNYDSTLGFVSDLKPPGTEDGPVPLLVVPGHANWVVSSLGVLDLTWLTPDSSPRTMAAIPEGVKWSAPLAASSATVVVDGLGKVVLLVAAGDTVWMADVTEARTSPLVAPAVFSPVVVPAPGLRLKSMTFIEGSDGGRSVAEAYVTNNTQIFKLETRDLVRWAMTPIVSPTEELPVEVWREGAKARVGTSDGTIWSLPIMVALSQPLPPGRMEPEVSDYALLCGTPIAASATNLWVLGSADGGLPAWKAQAEAGASFDRVRKARFYETGVADAGQLFAATVTGQVLELNTRCSP